MYKFKDEYSYEELLEQIKGMVWEQTREEYIGIATPYVEDVLEALNPYNYYYYDVSLEELVTILHDSGSSNSRIIQELGYYGTWNITYLTDWDMYVLSMQR